MTFKPGNDRGGVGQRHKHRLYAICLWVLSRGTIIGGGAGTAWTDSDQKISGALFLCTLILIDGGLGIYR